VQQQHDLSLISQRCSPSQEKLPEADVTACQQALYAKMKYFISNEFVSPLSAREVADHHFFEKHSWWHQLSDYTNDWI